MKTLLFVSLLIFFSACSHNNENEERPNILWISHEDLSPVYGCYGDEYASTPNIDRFAKNGIQFSNAYSNAPICAPARSTLITGMYASSLGTQHLRSEIPIPENMEILPELLQNAGYYTTNNVKTDYNFDPTGRWDESSNKAHWRNRPEDKPFFSVFNYTITHEGPTNALRDSDTESLSKHHDPDRAKIPPYLPDTPKMREIWAHKYDLLSVFDQQVGKLLNQLKEDGLLDNTIVFLFSDHGTGLPGHKRWLNNKGLQVPLIIHIPEKHKQWASNLTTPVTDQMVGFVDFAPTVLTLAGAEIPDIMQGRNFLGEESAGKDYIYGYRDRADDCYEMSRSIFDGRYLYVRHFMPHQPYYQNAVIFNKGGSYKEINRLKETGKLPQGTRDMLSPKPVEELYDLQNDPFEEHNLINNQNLSGIVADLREKLHTRILDNFDTGLLNEGEMMIRAQEGDYSVYEAIREYSRPQLKKVLEAALLTGKITNAGELEPYLKADDSAIRYWAVVAAQTYDGDISPIKTLLKDLLNDSSPAVAIASAELLIKRFDDKKALQTLENILKSDFEPVVLQAAISTRKLGKKAKPLLPAIKNDIMPKYSGDIWGRYRSWSYPMFIGMALDQTRINLGEEISIR